MSIIKKEFVRRILTEESERFDRNQTLQIRRFTTFHTGALERERHFSVSSDDTMDGMLTLRHKAYERFLDIKRKVKTKGSNTIKNRSIPIHNKFAFGHYYTIANRLMFDFTNEVADGIKRDFENK